MPSIIIDVLKTFLLIIITLIFFITCLYLWAKFISWYDKEYPL